MLEKFVDNFYDATISVGKFGVYMLGLGLIGYVVSKTFDITSSQATGVIIVAVVVYAGIKTMICEREDKE